jgi:GNAT superfamily N-acetyltransferase
MQIRKAIAQDIPELLPLMRELAEFEKYSQEFVITEQILLDQGFRRSPPDFHCIVAEENGRIVAFLVYYFVPYTYRAKPNMIIKEVYVAEGFRGKTIGCGRMKWWVAKWNKRGVDFYQRLGGSIDPDWHEFQMSEKTFRELAQS